MELMILKHPQTPPVNPTYYFLAQGLTAAVTIYFARNRSRWRLLSLVFILWFACLEFSSAFEAHTHSSNKQNTSLTANSFIYTAQLVNILWINSISAEDFKATEVPTTAHLSRIRNNSFWSILHLVTLNFRGIGTPWKIKTVPQFSTYYPGRIPQSRVQFLIRQIAIVIFQILVLDFTLTLFRTKHRLLGSGLTTREQWLFREHSSVIAWWLMNRCFLSASYNIISIIGVATRIYSIEDFPPLMGSISSAYTLRNYWGKYWHQTLRWPFSALSTLIIRDVLHLPKPSLLERYSSIFMIFTLSGILHVCTGIENGNMKWTSTLMYFQSYIFGIIVEDSVQALWRRITGEKFASKDEDVARWKKTCGYIWVVVFYSTVSIWFGYPASRQEPEKAFKSPTEITKVYGEKAVGTTIAVFGTVLLLVFKAEI